MFRKHDDKASWSVIVAAQQDLARSRAGIAWHVVARDGIIRR
jgi:hypothetical protein